MGTMLDRYHKAGGFLQLLNLIETCGTAKQEKFLEMIREEDPRWAQMIQMKMLTLKRIFSWQPEAIAEVIGHLNDLTLAVALHGLDADHKEKVFKTFTVSQRRKIDSLYETHNPTQSEISSTFLKIITEVRKMISEGRLRMDKYDPDLVVGDDIEEQLKRAAPIQRQADEPVAVKVEAAILPFEAPSKDKEDVANLKNKLASLSNENLSLKQEVAKLKSKLDQIRKIV